MVTGKNSSGSPRQELPLQPLKPKDTVMIDAYYAALPAEERVVYMRARFVDDDDGDDADDDDDNDDADIADGASASPSLLAAGVGGQGIPGCKDPKDCCHKAQGLDFADDNISHITGVRMNDCCILCNQTNGCAAGVWIAAEKVAHANGTCYLKKGRTKPVQHQDVTGWVPANAPVPTPAPPVPTPPTPPSPPTPSPPKGKCTKVQALGYADENLTISEGHDMNDCCDLCTGMRGCAVTQWAQSANNNGSHSYGTCIFKKSALKPVNANSGASFLPAGVTPPFPVIHTQAGIIVGEWKVVTGTAIQMAIFTGPHFPNASTPYGYIPNGAEEKVPQFCCSTPTKKACLFHITEDPTEHNDLGADPAHQDKLDELLGRLVAVAKTNFDPDRGPGDPAACVQIKANGGFFGPWLP
jgi:hypothetical protein